jgi:methionyl aminopeptidase
MAVPTRKPQEIEKIKKAAALVGKTLSLIRREAKAGVIGIELDKKVEDFIVSSGGRPSFKGLYDFPNSVCISRNEVIIHGIPDEIPFENGDIIGFDVGVEIDGWYGDAAITLPIGEISKEDDDLINISKDTLYYAIDNIKVGMRFKELSQLIGEYIHSRGYIPLKGYCGHGIGRKPHEEPQILNYLEGKAKSGEKIKNGMVFCIEPMICHKEGEPELYDDGWSVVSSDGLKGSHYEHQVAIIDNKAVILTKEN